LQEAGSFAEEKSSVSRKITKTTNGLSSAKFQENKHMAQRQSAKKNLGRCYKIEDFIFRAYENQIHCGTKFKMHHGH